MACYLYALTTPLRLPRLLVQFAHVFPKFLP